MADSDYSEPYEECGENGMQFSVRAACQLKKGHVKSLKDWHETTATATSQSDTNTFSQAVTTTETLRWRPNLFEVPEEVRRRFGPPEKEEDSK